MAKICGAGVPPCVMSTGNEPRATKNSNIIGARSPEWFLHILAHMRSQRMKPLINLTVKITLCMSLVLCLAVAACSDDSGEQSTTGDLTIKDSNSPPGPDRGKKDAKQPDAQKPDIHAAKDAGSADVFYKPYKCGAKSTCTTSQYCEGWHPGVYGGTFGGDGGVCPPDCTPASGKPGYCNCITYTCKPRPAGCNTCACMPKNKGCTCFYSAKMGGMSMDCYGA